MLNSVRPLTGNLLYVLILFNLVKVKKKLFLEIILSCLYSFLLKKVGYPATCVYYPYYPNTYYIFTYTTE